MISGTYEKFTANIILNSEKLKVYPLKSEQDNARFHHCYSTLYWKVLTRAIRQQKEIKSIQIVKEEVKLSICIYIILYVEGLVESTKHN